MREIDTSLTVPADSNPWATTSTSTSTSTTSSTSEPLPATTSAADPLLERATASDDPWQSSPAEPSSAPDWLNAAAANDTASGATASGEALGRWQQLWDGALPIESSINQGLDWLVQNFRPFFQTVRGPIDATLGGVEALLHSVPALALVALFGLLAWQFAGRAMALGGVICLLLVVLLGIWPEAMVTLSLVLTSLAFCVLVGLPLGVLLASSDGCQRVLRPLLDAMQTTPAFVYLVPVVMLMGIGNVPGVLVTVVFALPPLVRLTNLGIRQVRPDLIEAARAYGASPWQLLVKVQLPLAMPSIMAGINQTLMLSLSMVVIASMIAVGGLGQMVLRGIGRLDMGLATVGGLGIVLLAITLDRLTQALGRPRRGARHWWQTGPLALLVRCWPYPAGPARPTAATSPTFSAPLAPSKS